MKDVTHAIQSSRVNGRAAKLSLLLCLGLLGGTRLCLPLEIINATGGIMGRNVAIIAAPVGTYTIGAYSDLAGGAPLASVNAAVTAQLEVPPGVVPPAIYVPGAFAFNTGTWPFRTPWAGVGGSWTKPALAPPPGNVGTDVVQSHCPPVAANPDSSLGLGRILVTAASYTLRVRADLILTGMGVGGRGVGYSEDPYPVLPGTYPYAPVLTELSLTNQSGQVDATSALSFTAFSSLDSNSPVWFLNLTLRGDDSLDVEFRSSTNFFDFHLDDAAVKSNLLAALAFNDHSVMLRPELAAVGYTLFDTIFTATSAFEFGEDAGALAHAPARPALQIRSAGPAQVTLSWPTNAAGYHLQSSDSLLLPWATVTNVPARSGTGFNLTTEALKEQQYFRLQRQ